MSKKEKMKNWVLNMIRTVNTHHTGAYAAQAAYFFCIVSDTDFSSAYYDGTIHTGYDE